MDFPLQQIIIKFENPVFLPSVNKAAKKQNGDVRNFDERRRNVIIKSI
jgi:hypothetical protein